MSTSSENNVVDNGAKPTEEQPITTTHALTLESSDLRYTATVGRMPLKNEQGEIEAQMFFTAYTLEDTADVSARPLTFVFNGGPGSSSVWLHLGALGPKRVQMEDEGWMPAPPYKLVPNQHTWLTFSDLVFIDPVGTGYSRASKSDDNKKYWGLKADIEAVGEFIRLYLTRYGRWSSPLFLAGESYGTTRAAGLAGHLVDKGIAFNGIMLISTVLNFQTLNFGVGNDLPYILFLPTYTATAWYHGKLADDLQAKPLREVLAEVEAWAATDYTIALIQGDSLSDAERAEIVRKLARYTGVSDRWIDGSNLGVNIFLFCKELLRDEKRTVGRLDSRFKGIDALSVREAFEHDPSYSAIMPPYTAMLNDYMRRELGYETDRVYEILSFDVNMNWEYERGKLADTSDALRMAFSKNPYMQVFVGMGYYDLATPHFAAQYTFNHMNLDPVFRQNIHMADYEAGHMMYLDQASLVKLTEDVRAFVRVALGD